MRHPKERLSPASRLSVLGALLVGTLSLVLAYPTQRLVGAMFEADGQLDEATKYYRAWANKYPADYEARWHLASLLLDTAKPDDAVRELEGMHVDWPEDRDILERMVDIEDSLLRVEAVVPRLEALTRAHPDSLPLWHRLTDHYRWFGMKKKLEIALTRLVEIDGDDQAREELVDMLFGQERYDEIIKIFKKSLASSPDPIHAHLVLQDAYTRTGRLSEAKEHLQSLIDLEPGNQVYFEEMINLTIDMGDIEVAAALLKKRAESVKKAGGDLKGLANLYDYVTFQLSKAGLDQKAIAMQSDFVGYVPDSLEARIGLAELYPPKQVDAMAVKEVRDLLKQFPNHVEAWVVLGDRLSWMNRSRDALTAFRNAMSRAPSDAIRRRVIRQLTYVGRSEEALTEARDLAQNNVSEDKVMLIDILKDLGLRSEALSLAQDLYATQPSPRHKKVVDSLLRNDKSDPDADCANRIRTLSRLVSKDPDDVRSWFEIHDCAKLTANRQVEQRARANIIRLQGEGAL